MKTTTRRILFYELALHEALPWTLYDEFGNLLLREGYVIKQQRHLDALFARGAYIRVEEPEEVIEEAPVVRSEAASQRLPHNAAPVASRCTRMANSLERLHTDLQAGVMRNDMRMLVIGMAHVIAQACQDDADALLASLHTNRTHSYLVVHQLLGAALVELLAREAGIDEATRSSWVCAALTRDVGMVHLPPDTDANSALLQSEQSAEIRLHPTYSEAMLGRMGVKDAVWLQVVREHQERCDGSGYPQRLLKDAICEGARLLAVVDSYAAMVVPRSNRVAKPPHQALQSLYMERETAYDNLWVQRLVKSITLYPPGSMVQLHNGEHALVLKRQSNYKDMQVWAVQNQAGALLRPAQPRCTAQLDCEIEQAVELLPAAIAGLDLADWEQREELQAQAA